MSTVTATKKSDNRCEICGERLLSSEENCTGKYCRDLILIRHEISEVEEMKSINIFDKSRTAGETIKEIIHEVSETHSLNVFNRARFIGKITNAIN